MDSITSYFTENVAKPAKNNHYWWTCKHCEADLLGRDDNLTKHVLTTFHKVPEQTRTAEMTRIVNEPRPLPEKLRSLTPVLRRCPGGQGALGRSSAAAVATFLCVFGLSSSVRPEI